MQPGIGIPANLLKHRAFCAPRGREGHGCAQGNTPARPGLNIDGMPNRKKKKIFFRNSVTKSPDAP
jgi:hypothetical protein